jgi:hypothetical protein
MHSLLKLGEVALNPHQFEKDKGGQRTGIERRKFSYSLYIPESALVRKAQKS